jgi:adenosyl cobinamide kinase/adenosyl cobinamide phosphate guanylyltransferase
MDDKLVRIQKDLDDVIDRLAEYINSDKIDTISEPTASDMAVAARAVLHYVTTEGEALVHSVEAARFSANSSAGSHPIMKILDSESLVFSNRLVDFLKALVAVDIWEHTRWPLEEKHMQALSEAISAWSAKECQFIGESVGLPLTPKREVDRRRRDRQQAALHVLELHLSNSQRHPVDEALFEEVGRHCSMSSSTVSRAYYSPEFKKFREAAFQLKKSLLSGLEEK